MLKKKVNFLVLASPLPQQNSLIKIVTLYFILVYKYLRKHSFEYLTGPINTQLIHAFIKHLSSTSSGSNSITSSALMMFSLY